MVLLDGLEKASDTAADSLKEKIQNLRDDKIPSTGVTTTVSTSAIAPELKSMFHEDPLRVISILL